MFAYWTLSGVTTIKIFAVLLKSIVLRLTSMLNTCNSTLHALAMSAPLAISYILFFIEFYIQFRFLLHVLFSVCISVWIRWQLSDRRDFVLNLPVYFRLTKHLIFKRFPESRHRSNEKLTFEWRRLYFRIIFLLIPRRCSN